jgi:hypothetical protein
MKITLKRVYVSADASLEDAILNIEGVGEVTVQGSLPDEIKGRIEEHYRELFLKRLAETQSN